MKSIMLVTAVSSFAVDYSPDPLGVTCVAALIGKSVYCDGGFFFDTERVLASSESYYYRSVQ